MAVKGALVGGIRHLIVKLAIEAKTSTKRAQVRIAHPKPICSISFRTMIGKITPPKLDPHAAILNATARFFMNQVAKQDEAG